MEDKVPSEPLPTDGANTATSPATQWDLKEFRISVERDFVAQRQLLSEIQKSLRQPLLVPPVPRIPSREPSPVASRELTHGHGSHHGRSPLSAAVATLHRHDAPGQAAPSGEAYRLGRLSSNISLERVKSDSEQRRPSFQVPVGQEAEPSGRRNSHFSQSSLQEGRRERRKSETSLLSLESAPTAAPPPAKPQLKSPTSQVSASATEELMKTLDNGTGLQEAATSMTATFVTSQINQQQRKAEMAARRHSEKKMSSISFYALSERSGENRSHFARLAEKITSSPTFTYGIMAVIVFNMVMLGVEVDVTATLGQNDIHPGFVIANAAVVVIFICELLLIMRAHGIRNFFLGPERSWNIFDFTIIAWSVLETSIELWAFSVSSDPAAQVSASQLRFVRTMRLVRAFRGVRVVRLLRYVSALRTLVLSIISSMASLCWTLALLVLLFYSFGIVFTQLVVDYCRDEAVKLTGDANAIPKCSSDISKFWSSVPESMLTLFLAITSGINWADALEPLREVGPVAVFCMIVYVAIAVLAVVNVVTGVFCSTAMESASADKEIATMKQLQKKNAQVADLRHVFEEIVDVETNLVNIKEFQQAMLLPKFANFLESMSISTEDIGILFTVMDSDRSGLIDLDEFVQGCLQLHGPAKSLQIARMSFENKITRQAIKAIGGAMIELKQELEELSRRVMLFCV